MRLLNINQLSNCPKINQLSNEKREINSNKDKLNQEHKAVKTDMIDKEKVHLADVDNYKLLTSILN